MPVLLFVVIPGLFAASWRTEPGIHLDFADSKIDIHVLFRAHPLRASPFLALPKKGRRRLGAGGGGLGNIVLPRLPCASRRSRAGANSAIRGLEHARLARAIGCDARHRQRRRSVLRRPAIHGLLR
jgi:hypothetical protein